MKVGFLGVLALVFITLKLTEAIAWSWIWVLSPLWIGFVLLGTILISMKIIIYYLEHVSNKSTK